MSKAKGGTPGPVPFGIRRSTFSFPRFDHQGRGGVQATSTTIVIVNIGMADYRLHRQRTKIIGYDIILGKDVHRSTGVLRNSIWVEL